MATKKRGCVKVIDETDLVSIDEDLNKPKCFNNKCLYCKKELCGDYFDDCQFYDAIGSLDSDIPL